MRSCRYPNCGCEYDGRLSVLWFKGKLLLYARANVKPRGGGRYVQLAIASSESSDTGCAEQSGSKSFGPFSLINLMGYDMYQGNIYTWSVSVNPVDQDSLLALFPISDSSRDRSSIPYTNRTNAGCSGCGCGVPRSWAQCLQVRAALWRRSAAAPPAF